MLFGPWRIFEDMAFEVGAVRPRVGTNDGVRHFLNRRVKTEVWDFDHALEKETLERTLGVILYQDQVNHGAMEIAGFTASKPTGCGVLSAKEITKI